MVLTGLALLLQDAAQLGWALAFVASGSLLQTVGHWYEGRRPALGLLNWLLAPVFVGLQGLHRLGLAQSLWSAVEQGAGPRRLRDLAQAR